MDRFLPLILALTAMLWLVALSAADNPKPLIQVFYKNKAPSLQALEKINAALEAYAEKYDILYHDIEDPENLELISSLGLPATHFPVAVVIDGKFTIQRDGRIASFVHFPDFMQGLGRHEGNWSIADLEAALADSSLFGETNILPVLEEEESDSHCE